MKLKRGVASKVQLCTADPERIARLEYQEKDAGVEPSHVGGIDGRENANGTRASCWSW
jgi:hypothetical protein